jgi:hypothetical protein
MRTLEPAAQPAAALEALLETLCDAAVRDLAWLLFSPDLLRAQPPGGMLASPFESPEEASAAAAWLLALDHAADDLHRDVAASRVTRLGRYAECLLAHFLARGPAARLVAANIPLRRAGRTLGECDFLVETASGRRLHWELAVKCYLHAGGARMPMAALSAEPSAELSDYVGPNLQDRFDIKLAHLLDHQLPLSAREEFASLGHAGPWDAQMFVKGWLFYRWGEAPPAPPAIDPSHARGWWIARADWPRLAARQADAWVVLPRLAWLAPRRLTADRASAAPELLGSEALIAQLARQSGPTMVAALARDGGAGWLERSRGFVVPDDWPERAFAFARQCPD